MTNKIIKLTDEVINESGPLIITQVTVNRETVAGPNGQRRVSRTLVNFDLEVMMRTNEAKVLLDAARGARYLWCEYYGNERKYLVIGMSTSLSDGTYTFNCEML